MKYPVYILAGGKSTRMGQDKGLMKIRGKELILYSLDCVQSLASEIHIISSNKEYEHLGFSLIEDTIPNKGPAQGVITALNHCTSDSCILLSCDMPLVNEQVIQKMIEQIKDKEICCYKKDMLYPFPGIYSRSILQKWQELLHEGNAKMHWLIKQFSYKTLPIEQAELFLNVNAEADFLLSAKKLK